MQTSSTIHWPSEWVGESVIDCGANGRMRARLIIIGDVMPVHREVFSSIISQWYEVWEVVEDLVTGMGEGCDDLPELCHPHANLIISLPNERITDGTGWSVAVEFPNHGSTWNVEFDGWDYSEEGTQPIC